MKRRYRQDKAPFVSKGPRIPIIDKRYLLKLLVNASTKLSAKPRFLSQIKKEDERSFRKDSITLTDFRLEANEKLLSSSVRFLESAIPLS